jgi:hypothetical protein
MKLARSPPKVGAKPVVPLVVPKNWLPKLN